MYFKFILMKLSFCCTSVEAKTLSNIFGDKDTNTGEQIPIKVLCICILVGFSQTPIQNTV